MAFGLGTREGTMYIRLHQGENNGRIANENENVTSHYYFQHFMKQKNYY